MRRAVLAVAVVLAALAAPAAAAPPGVQAKAFYVQSGLDGTVLAARNADARRAVASITKLMTALVVLERASLDDVVIVSPRAAGIGEATILLRPREVVTVRDLIVGALVPSANDAATALALHVGNGSLRRFAAMMNRKARLLGLRDTHFVNPHGLDASGHASSARDAVRLLRAALRNPFIRETVHRRTAELAGGRTVETTDDLLARFPPLLGGKTGHTTRAGWSQVAAAQGPGVIVYAAVLGGASRAQRNDDLEKLLRWALGEYRSIAAIASGRTYARIPAPYGLPAIRLVAERPAVRAARLGRTLVERVVAPSRVALPVAKGQELGEVQVYDGSRLVASSPLVAAVGLAEPGRRAKVRWYATRTLHHLVGLVS